MTAWLPHREVRRSIAVVVIGLVAGALVDYPGVGLVIGLVVALARQLLSLQELARWAADVTQPIPDSPGTWAQVYRAIHQLRRNERRAQQNLMNIIARARASVSALDDGVLLIDNTGALEWWNPAAARLLGLNERDLGQPVTNIIRQPAFLRYFHDAHGDNTSGLKLPSLRRPGQQLQFEITRFGDNDKLLLVYDVTQLHHLEQMRKDFVANVSHELRTPLTVLSGYLETLEPLVDDGPPALKRVMSAMQAQTQRMTLLVNDLLYLSRLEAQGMTPHLEAVDVPALVSRLVADAQVIATPRQQRLTADIAADVQLMGAAANLESAFSNLIMNALKYTPDHSHIEVRWQLTPNGPAFQVHDNGPGIAAEHLPRLTERFYRVDEGRSRQSGGTGLGLAIVKHVLMQHGGELLITSTQGVGSTFTAQFPARLAVTASAASPVT